MLKKFLNNLSITIVTKTDRWYVKSKLPKIIKEFIFLGFMLFGTLIGDLSDWMK